MEKYDYTDAVEDDVIEYIRNYIDFTDFDTLTDMEDYLYNKLYYSGGNYEERKRTEPEAALYLSDNFDLLSRSLKHFDLGVDYLSRGPLACDLIVRRFVLRSAVAYAATFFMDDFDEAHGGDYDWALQQDTLKYIHDNVDLSSYASPEDLKKYLNTALADSPYTDGSMKGTEINTLKEANPEAFSKYFDLLSYLPDAVSAAVDQIEDEFNAAHEAEDEPEM